MAVCLSAALASASAAQDADAPARAELLVSHSSIVPGQDFQLALRFNIEPGWHLYWRDAGDAGMPIGIDWELPDGFTAGALRWPTPRRFDDGDIVAFGYQDAVVLSATISAPAELDADRVRLGARVRWLACKEICLPGSATLERELAVGSDEPADAAEAIAASAAAAPREAEADELRIATVAHTALEGGGWRIAVTLDGAIADTANDFYPAPTDGCLIDYGAIAVAESATKGCHNFAARKRSSCLLTLSCLFLLN